MTAAALTKPWLDDIFKSAKRDFLKKLPKSIQFDPTQITTMEDVYSAAKAIEEQQKKTKTYCGLKRIEPLLKSLGEFAGAIDVLVQVKPDILSLIWVQSTPQRLNLRH